MAQKIASKELSATNNDIVNSIINSEGINVPLIGENGVTYQEIGQLILADSGLTNDFLSALMNRIGRVIVTSKIYNNPWERFKKGLLENGEVIEELFVELIDGHIQDWNDESDDNPFKREKPDVRSAFHPLNLKSRYDVTITIAELRTAFLNSTGITDLIGKITEKLYTSANLDEFYLMKYVLAQAILSGNVKGIEIPQFTTTDDLRDIVSTVKSTSNKFTFMSQNYNTMGVHTSTPKENQYVLIQSDFEAQMDVNVLASAFNMDKADFAGNRMLVDSFGAIDNKRLANIIADYVPLTDAQLAVLDSIPCVLIDDDFFQIYDQTLEFTEQYNGKKRYWNYFLHVWKIASFSPFMSSCVFVNGEPTVTSVTANPTTMTITNGQNGVLTTTVETEFFADQTVTYTSSDEDIAVVTQAGVIHTKATGTVTITATSNYDTTKSVTCVVTVE